MLFVSMWHKVWPGYILRQLLLRDINYYGRGRAQRESLRNITLNILPPSPLPPFLSLFQQLIAFLSRCIFGSVHGLLAPSDDALLPGHKYFYVATFPLQFTFIC